MIFNVETNSKTVIINYIEIYPEDKDIHEFMKFTLTKNWAIAQANYQKEQIAFNRNSKNKLQK